MSVTTIPPQGLYPIPSHNAGGTSSFSSINSTDDWVAFVFIWPGGDLTKFAFIPTAVSGSPVVTCQLFNVSTSDGSVNIASAIGSAVDSSTLVANTTQIISGIGQSSLAYGVYAMRLIFKSGTSCSIGRQLSAFSVSGNYQTPYTVSVTDGGSQTKAAFTSPGLVSFGNASGYISVLGYMGASFYTSSGTFADTSNPDEYGIWFTNTWPVSIRVCGVFFDTIANARPDCRVAYYTGTIASPTAAYSATADRDQTASNTAFGLNFIQFETKQLLAVGASAGIGIRAATTHNLNIPYLDFLSGNQALMDSWWGQNATIFTRENDTGALTQTTYRTPLIVPVIDGIESANVINVSNVAILDGPSRVLSF